MLLIKLAREAAEKRAADEAEWKLREAHLQDRLEKLKKLVLAEVLQMDLEPCKYGKFIVTQEDGAVILVSGRNGPELWICIRHYSDFESLQWPPKHCCKGIGAWF